MRKQCRCFSKKKKKRNILFQMCYDHHVYVVLEELKGCYELWGSWVLDLKRTQQHIIRPRTQCMSCRACEVSTRAYATPFMYVQPVRLIPPPTRGGQESQRREGVSIWPASRLNGGGVVRSAGAASDDTLWGLDRQLSEQASSLSTQPPSGPVRQRHQRLSGTCAHLTSNQGWCM